MLTRMAEDPAHFHYNFCNRIGLGMFGNVYKATYTGTNQAIRDLCQSPSNILAFKTADKFNLTELAVISHLYQQAKNNPESEPKYCLSVPIEGKNGEIVGIALEYISYGINHNSELISSNLQSLLYTAALNDPEKKGIVLGFDICNVFPLLLNAMWQAVKAVHDCDVVHGDISGRNFVAAEPIIDENGNLVDFPVKVVDFGLSHVIQGLSPAYHDDKQHIPFHFRNREALTSHRKYITKFTDLFALRVAAIELLGSMLGIYPNLFLTFNPALCVSDPTGVNFSDLQKKKKIDDKSAIHAYLKNILAVTEYDVRSQKIKDMISFYLPYLTNLPQGQSIEEMHKDDYRLLQQASINYRNFLASDTSRYCSHPDKTVAIHKANSDDGYDREKSGYTIDPENSENLGNSKFSPRKSPSKSPSRSPSKTKADMSRTLKVSPVKPMSPLNGRTTSSNQSGDNDAKPNSALFFKSENHKPDTSDAAVADNKNKKSIKVHRGPP